MGVLDQFAKQTFAEETEAVTRGAMSWEMPPELNLSEVRLDGMLLVRKKSLLRELGAPWSLALPHDQIAFEVKMPGDHLGVKALERALLRRQAWQVQRVEEGKPPWRGQVPLWMLTSRVPAMLPALRKISLVAPGCHAVETGSFSFLWIASNELPLREDLIPFLIARSGRPLDTFARWVSRRRPPSWVLRMIQIVPMSIDLQDEIARYVPRTDEPEIRARQRRVARVLLEVDPELRAEVTSEAIDQGLQPLVHQFERRLSRRLEKTEHQILHARLGRLGPERLGDVVFDLAPDALADWLADPAAT